MTDDSDAATLVPRDPPAPEVTHPFVLTATEGSSRGESLTIAPDHPTRILIGSSPACDLTLDDAVVSRRHLSLEIVGARLRLRDLDSTNGTEVDGLAVAEVFLRGGETIRLGSSALTCARGEATRGVLPQAGRFGRMLGQSPAMRRLYPLCERLATATMPVIVEGETGAGKELLAEALHAAGPRAREPFVVFDCSAVAPELIEEELFGRERGNLDGTKSIQVGVFERADGGTLVIDEVADLPLPLQQSLLRALERKQVTRVGSAEPLTVDVRILATTRRDLDQLVQAEQFRDDLYHRLAGARLEIPPLRDRVGDVRLLTRHFWSELGGDPKALPDDLLQRWSHDKWPGNVRELRNAVTRRLALGDLLEERDEADDMELTILDGSAGSSRGAIHTVSPAGDPIAAVLALDLPLADARQKIVQEFEHRYVDRVLALHNGNVTRASAAAGVARRHLQRLKARFRGE